MRKLLAAAIILSLSAPAIGRSVPSMSSPPGSQGSHGGPAHNVPPPSVGSHHPHGDYGQLSNRQLLLMYRNKLKPLRAEILARRAAEGGELSAASRAEFQTRLDETNEEFRRSLKRMGYVTS
jgi:hypothetical protein